MGGLKKAYQIVALLALAHLLALGGVIGYLAGTGKLTGEHLQQMAEVLRGGPQEAAAEPVDTDVPDAPLSESKSPVGTNRTTEEIGRYMADRRRAELDQQAATIRDYRLQVTREREAFRREVAEWEAQWQRRQDQEQSEGFKKDLEIFSALKAKDAMHYLLQNPVEEVARMLQQMDPRKAKKIIEAAKTQAARKKMSEVLQAMREISPEPAEALNKKKGN
ncbi:MAG: hypothetical protein IID40_10020 [Planctomycetes bacterium]|nr:hypothetical protein [Planctomycetota bacterium]